MISSFPWHQKQEEKYKQTDLTILNDVPLPQYQTETEKHEQTEIYPTLLMSPSRDTKHKQKNTKRQRFIQS